MYFDDRGIVSLVFINIAQTGNRKGLVESCSVVKHLCIVVHKEVNKQEEMKNLKVEVKCIVMRRSFVV